VHRAEKMIEESSIGAYRVPFLRIRTPQGEVHFDPIARVVLGGSDGRVDLQAWPSMHRLLLLRYGDDVQIQDDWNKRIRRAWNRKTFTDLAVELTSKR
jgi:hypothetical protein